MQANPYSRYQETAVMTGTSPVQLVVMLYDAALRACRAAQDAIGAGKLQQANESLLKAQRIVAELQRTLDLERGAELAANLDALYKYIHSRLVAANLKKQREPIAEAYSFLLELRSAWAKMAADQGR